MATIVQKCTRSCLTISNRPFEEGFKVQSRKKTRITPSVSLDIDSSNDIILQNISPNPKPPNREKLPVPKLSSGKWIHAAGGFLRWAFFCGTSWIAPICPLGSLIHFRQVVNQLMVHWWFGLVWIAGIPHERDCYLGVPLESQPVYH